MSNVKEQIAAEITMPKVIRMPLEDHKYDNSILAEVLNSQEVRTIPADQVGTLFGWEPTPLLPEYEAIWKSLDNTASWNGGYSQLKDGYGVCELFSASRRLIVTEDYLKYIKGSGQPFKVNIYGHKNTLISKKMWNFCEHPEGRAKFCNGEVEPCRFEAPEITFFSAFEEIGYWHQVYIESCQDSIAVLATNLPHEYYRTQNLRASIFTWDIGDEKYRVGGKDMVEIDRLINHIAARGIQEPLYFRINEGCLTPVDNDTTIMLFIATYLNLPTIPVVLFMSDDEGVKNKGYEELHEIIHSNFWHDQQAIDMTNNALSPYFVFEMKDSPTPGIIKVGDNILSSSQYPAMSNVNDTTTRVIDRYLDPNAKAAKVPTPMSEEEKAAQSAERFRVMRETILKEQRDHNDRVIERILAGEFTQGIV